MTWRINRPPFEILVVPVLQDNLVYLVCRGGRAVLIDAGAADPVRRALKKNKLVLTDILLTHRHADHTAGEREVRSLIDRGEGRVEATVDSLPVPGHTAGDTAWYFPEARALFTGDALINGACGRPIEGSAAQLYESLQRINALPGDTLILGGHDYLDENLRFGLAIDAGNAAIRARLDLYRRDPAAALFVPLDEERRTNVFLQAQSAGEFATLRQAKNRFAG